MNTPSPTALAIAIALEAALTPIIAALTAPLQAQIDELTKAVHPGEPSDAFVEKVLNAVLTDDAFDKAVLSVIEDNSKNVIENLGDDLTDKITNSDTVHDAVAEVIRRGSFNVEFSRF